MWPELAKNINVLGSGDNLCWEFEGHWRNFSWDNQRVTGPHLLKFSISSVQACTLVRLPWPMALPGPSRVSAPLWSKTPTLLRPSPGWLPAIRTTSGHPGSGWRRNAAEATWLAEPRPWRSLSPMDPSSYSATNGSLRRLTRTWH